MAEIELRNIEKVYDNGFHAIKNLSLSVTDGEFLVLVGPSGCGKTTALRMIAGLEQITAGDLLIGDQVVNNLSPRQRDIAMVFQSYALYPHLSVGSNIGFGLELRKVAKPTVREKVASVAKTLDLTTMLNRKPKQLSGGQRQRVAMGRAIVREPSVFLMDEPLSNLDAKLRVQMRAEISTLQRRLGTTTVYVTHDQIEAMTMGDRVAVMRLGELQQIATPSELYDYPANLFVAGFIGTPPMTMFHAKLTRDGDGGTLSFGSQTMHLSATVLNTRPALRGRDSADLVVGIRSEDLYLDNDALPKMSVQTELVESLGSSKHIHFLLDAMPVGEEQLSGGVADPEDLARLGSDEGTRGVAALGPRADVKAGTTLSLGVDTERIHFFDSASGLAIRN
jgi:multiple sugar transport system ATP-binding protein